MKLSAKFNKACNNLSNAIKLTSELINEDGTIKNISKEDEFTYDAEKMKVINFVAAAMEGNGVYYKFVKGLIFQITSESQIISRSVVDGKIIESIEKSIKVREAKPSIGFVFDLFNHEFTIIAEKTPKQLARLSDIRIEERDHQEKIYPLNATIFDSITSYIPKSIIENEAIKQAKIEKAAKIEAAEATEAAQIEAASKK